MIKKCMNNLEFIVALAGLFLTNIGTFLQQNYARRKDKKDLDEKQSEQINNLSTKLDHILCYVADNDFKSNLSDALKIKSQNIIEANTDLDSDIISLLLFGRDLLIKFAKAIYFSNANITEKFLLNEVNTVMDRLKLFSNEYFKEVKEFPAYDPITKKNVHVDGNYTNYLRNAARINDLIRGFIENIITLKTNKFGEQTKEKYIEYFVDFEGIIYIEAITAYRKFMRL